MPRFVILTHDHPHLHWDLMLEDGGRLLTWRLSQPPTPAGGPIRAEPLGDHRLAYLEYEGPVSGNRGRVSRWDAGTYTAQTPWQEGKPWAIELQGEVVRGKFMLCAEILEPKT